MTDQSQVFERWPSRPLFGRALLWLACVALFWSFMATNLPPRSWYEPLVKEAFGNRAVQLTFLFLLAVFFSLPHVWERWQRLRFGHCSIVDGVASFRLSSSVYRWVEHQVDLADLTEFRSTSHGVLVRDARRTGLRSFFAPLLIPANSEEEQARVLRLLEANQPTGPDLSLD